MADKDEKPKEVHNHPKSAPPPDAAEAEGEVPQNPPPAQPLGTTPGPPKTEEPPKS